MQRWLAAAAALWLMGCGENSAQRKAKEKPAVRKEEPERPPPVNRLVFGGDVMLSRHVAARMKAANDPALPFRKIAPFFASADLAFVNLESPFSDKGNPPTTGMVFKAPPNGIEGLLLAGIDVVSTANNHTRDQHEYGMLYTLDWLEKNKIAAVGSGRDEAAARRGAVLTSNTVKFGFLAYTYDQRNGNHKEDDNRINGLDIVRMREDVAAIRQIANVTIVSLHAGVEYAKAPHPLQRQFAEAAIEAGVTLVIGHHPHVVQPCEEYRTGVICYSLGNLVFDQTLPGTNDGLVAEAEFKGFSLRKLRTHKVHITNTVPELETKR
ncbi:MAG TPA: CapA family protein [Bryobacteraceae bacterium]|nr:CapA family protein [Bryobacteraceae bacterium]